LTSHVLNPGVNHLSLFSGIGGLDLAAEWAGFKTVAFVERDPYCQRVLAKRWPGVPIIEDVRLVANASSRGREGVSQPDERALESEQQASRRGDALGLAADIRIVSGGFPCQPHSVAGKRQASADDRDLWPEVARVLREIRPRWFVGENVRGLLHSESGRFFGGILGDLADLGYSVGWGVWGASDVGALHQRERVFIVAYSGDDRLGEPLQPERQRGRELTADIGGDGAIRSVAHAERERGRRGHAEREDAEDAWESSGREEHGHWLVEPDVGRVAHGVPARVDRLRALGNAVVPQQAYPLFAEIARIERLRP
jgi:DNA (cytosine-5)-methyltransferase 1